MPDETESVAEAAPAAAPRPRGVAFARIWTAQTEPVTPALVSDELFGRGFVPGVITDPTGEAAALSDAGLADARFTVGGDGIRFVSLSSSKGSGSLVRAHESSESDLPDDYLARRTVHRPRLVYHVEAGGPGNSDRNLCENIAEVLMLLTSGVVELGGLGVKGNRPQLYASRWVGTIRH